MAPSPSGGRLRTMSIAKHIGGRETVLAALALATACGGKVTHVQTSRPEDPHRRIRAIASEYAAGYNTMFPGPEYFGRTFPGGDALPDNSLAALAAWQRREEAWMSQLRAIDRDTFWGTPEWVVSGYLRTALQTSIATRSCRAELWPAHQFGWLTSLVEMLDIQPVGTKEARAQALARWSQLPRYLETELANLREGIRLGYSAP